APVPPPTGESACVATDCPSFGIVTAHVPSAPLFPYTTLFRSPPALVTETGPETAPAATVTFNCVPPARIVNGDATPPTFADVVQIESAHVCTPATQSTRMPATPENTTSIVGRPLIVAGVLDVV